MAEQDDPPTTVNVVNFARAETDRMFTGLAAQAGGTNRWKHHRVPAPLDEQTVIRQNRDTLYSLAIVDIRNGARLTIPEHGDRYLSVMIVNEDHYINRVFHDAGTFELTVDEFDTPWVLVASRILVDPSDPADVAEVNRIQDGYSLEVASDAAFVSPSYDAASLDATRVPLLELSRGLTDFSSAFGRKLDVDPVQHLLGAAAGWGGLPAEEATYLNFDGLPFADHQLVLRDVPVDAFWSISVYNAEGFFEPNDRGMNTVNSVTAVKEADGSTIVRFGSGDAPNTIPIMEGWNYAVRLYRPRAEILDRTWKFPEAQPR
jgi:hypothetical protein